MRKLNLRPIYLALTSTLLISACATQNPINEANEAAPSQPAASDEPVVTPVPAKSLTGETLFQLLLAEMAINREEFGLAANLYGQLALRDPDIGVLERGVALNQSIRNYPQSSALAQVWASKDPNNEAAWRALAITAVSNKDIEQAQQAIRSWMLINPNAEVTLLSNGLSDLSLAEQSSMLSTALELTEAYPKSDQLNYLVAQLSGQADDFNTAQTYIEAAIQLNPAPSYRLFQYQLLIAKEEFAAASDLIARLYQENPNDQNIAVQYARHLFRFQRDDVKTLQILHTQNSQEPIIARTFARAAFESGEFDLAEGVFLHLAEQGYADEGYYFLGLISLENQLPNSAIEYFSRVKNPPYLASALIEWLQVVEQPGADDLNQALSNALDTDPEQFETYWRIKATLAQQFGSTQSAYDVFESALDKHPMQATFLYEQALLAATLDKYDVLENNLAEVLRQQPSNANALNALGYTWADLNKNLVQAEQYIDQALEQEPNNPAFLDSKGWVLYRAGNYEAALSYLERAYEELQVDEVAAHLAEVHWALGQRDKAREYLQAIRGLNENSRFISYLEALFGD